MTFTFCHGRPKCLLIVPATKFRNISYVRCLSVYLLTFLANCVKFCSFNNRSTCILLLLLVEFNWVAERFIDCVSTPIGGIYRLLKAKLELENNWFYNLKQFRTSKMCQIKRFAPFDSGRPKNSINKWHLDDSCLKILTDKYHCPVCWLLSTNFYPIPTVQ